MLEVPQRLVQTPRTSSTSLISRDSIPSTTLLYHRAQKRMMVQRYNDNNNVYPNDREKSAPVLLLNRVMRRNKSWYLVICYMYVLCGYSTRHCLALTSSSPSRASLRIKYQVQNEDTKFSYEETLEALKVYYAYHGNLVLPRRYIIPEDLRVSNDVDGLYKLRFPEQFKHVDLARYVYNLKWWQQNVSGHPERVAELNKMNFIWTRIQDEWNLVVEALCTYVSENGTTAVPYSFYVPHEKVWPIETWGLPLGKIVYRIRSRGDFVRGREDRVRQLNMLGFVWDLKEHAFFKFYKALKFYGKNVHNWQEHKIIRVPSTYVVPNKQVSGVQWPKDLHGYPLGAKCQAIRQKEIYVKENPERKMLLESIGFQWSGNSDLGWLKTIHAAAIYSQIHNRVLDVPYKFVVPSPPDKGSPMNEDQQDAMEYCDNFGCYEDWVWPEYLWGFKLGQRLKDVRVKRAYLKGDTARSRIAQLNALGFVWDPKRGRKSNNDLLQTAVSKRLASVERVKVDQTTENSEQARSIFSFPP